MLALPSVWTCRPRRGPRPCSANCAPCPTTPPSLAPRTPFRWPTGSPPAPAGPAGRLGRSWTALCPWPGCLPRSKTEPLPTATTSWSGPKARRRAASSQAKAERQAAGRRRAAGRLCERSGNNGNTGINPSPLLCAAALAVEVAGPAVATQDLQLLAGQRPLLGRSQVGGYARRGAHPGDHGGNGRVRKAKAQDHLLAVAGEVVGPEIVLGELGVGGHLPGQGALV